MRESFHELARARARRVIRRGLRRLGVDIVRYTPLNFAHLRRARILQEAGITLTLDVGASTGEFAKELRTYGYTGRIASFEPLATPYAVLERRARSDPDWQCHRLALGDRDGHAILNVARNTASSSLLPMGSRHVATAPESAYVGEETVELARLDSVAPPIVRKEDRVFLKLDVQGAEEAVLAGAAMTLSQVFVLETELSLVPLYEGQASLTKMLEQLLAHGYALASLEGVFADLEHGHLLQVNGIFVTTTPTASVKLGSDLDAPPAL